MTDPALDRIAQEKFSKNFEELDSMQKIQVGGECVQQCEQYCSLPASIDD